MKGTIIEFDENGMLTVSSQKPQVSHASRPLSDSIRGFVEDIKPDIQGLLFGVIQPMDGSDTIRFDSRGLLGDYTMVDISVGMYVGFNLEIGRNRRRFASKVKQLGKCETTDEGYIEKFFRDKLYGYIDENIYFLASQIMNQEDYDINTFVKRYKVQFNSISLGNGQKKAYNITIVDAENKQPGSAANLLPTRDDNQSADALDRIYSLLKPRLHSGESILLSDFGQLLKDIGIDYKKFGCLKLIDFCKQFPTFLTIVYDRNNPMHPMVRFEKNSGVLLKEQVIDKKNSGVLLKGLVIDKIIDGNTKRPFCLVHAEESDTKKVAFYSQHLRGCVMDQINEGTYISYNILIKPNGKKYANNVSLAGVYEEFEEGIITYYDSVKGIGSIGMNREVYFKERNITNLNDYSIDITAKEYKVRYNTVPNTGHASPKRALNIFIISEADKSPDSVTEYIPPPAITMSKEIIDKVYSSLEPHLSDGEKASLTHINQLLINSGINYTEQGFTRHIDFFRQFPTFLTLEYNADNLTRSKVRFNKKCNIEVEEITEEIQMAVYIKLSVDFKVGMLWPLPAIIKQMEAHGFTPARFGYGSHTQDKKKFLEQFSDFLAIDNIAEDGLYHLKVIVSRVRKWENLNEDEKNVAGLQNLTTPGIDDSIIMDDFTEDEKSIVLVLEEVFRIRRHRVYVSNDDVRYSYLLIKPTEPFTKYFGLRHEIVLLLDAASVFDIKSIEAIKGIMDDIQSESSFSLDRICGVLVSGDVGIATHINATYAALKSNDKFTVIPMSYSEVLNKGGTKWPVEWRDYVIMRFKEFFYERDLFAQSEALTNDLFFFGRGDYVNKLVKKHLNSECSGVFGLRKSGKTSVLNNICLQLDRLNKKRIIMDGPFISTRPWNLALHDIVKRAYKVYGKRFNRSPLKYTPEEAIILFEDDLLKLEKLQNGVPLLVMIDEIEEITFGVSAEELWRTGNAFTRFWGTLRSFKQRHPHILTYIIAGTKAMAIERHKINRDDNPIYLWVDIDYLPPFSLSDVKLMVNTLGGYLGLTFDDDVCNKLKQEFGGLPFLIRKFCHILYTYIKDKDLEYSRPLVVKNQLYELVHNNFKYSTVLQDACAMCLDPIKEFYKSEYQLLKQIAQNDGLIEIDRRNRDGIDHLISYGLVEIKGNQIKIINNAILRYLLDIPIDEEVPDCDKERGTILKCRNDEIEVKLRTFIKLRLKERYGEEEARKIRLDNMKFNQMSDHRKAVIKKLSYDDLFNTKCCLINWLDYVSLVELCQNDFKDYFVDIRAFKSFANICNSSRQYFSHPEDPDGSSDNSRKNDEYIESDMFELCMSAYKWFEGKLKGWNGTG